MYGRLVLFDIDGTLAVPTTSTPAHHLAFSRAIKETYGIDLGPKLAFTHGLTDRLIIIELLEKNGMKREEIMLKIDECIDQMPEFFNESLKDNPNRLLEGAKELLEDLEHRNILLGLVTGNIEPIAKVKLENLDIWKYFKLGGFGNEDMDRANLAKLAIKKAEQEFSFKRDDNIFLIGDTPFDINAGRIAMVKTISVSTGVYSMDQLKNEKADFVVNNLKNKDKLIKIILNGKI